MRITTKKVSLHSMRIYLQKYQWLQTVAQSRCDGYTTGSFWAMMCIRLQNYLQYQLPIEYKFLYCYSTLSLHLFFCTFAPWVISSSQCLFSPNFCFCVLTEALQIACITTMMNMTFRHCRFIAQKYFFGPKQSRLALIITDWLTDSKITELKTVLFPSRIRGVEKYF